jgi:hypothetical protein
MGGGVKVILTVIVYLCLLCALGIVSLFTPRPEMIEVRDDDV